jgi:hypothetical protein
MAKAIAAMKSGDNSLGLIWESNGVRSVVFNDTVILDVNQGIEIRNVNNEKEAYIDLVDLISEQVDKISE